jgi:hypothetical protein
MGQIRFQIGVPRAGSAARNSEQEEAITSVERLALPRAGSAARAAEEEKAASGPISRPQAGFSLRGQNGIVTRNNPVTSATFNSAGQQVTPLGTRLPHDAPVPPSVSTPELAKSNGGTSAQSAAGPLQLAASRFQTLVRSLFTSSETSGKS